MQETRYGFLAGTLRYISIKKYIYKKRKEKRSTTIITLKNSTGTCFVYITMALGQSIDMSKEVCLYADADWLRLICQSEGGEKSIVWDASDSA